MSLSFYNIAYINHRLIQLLMGWNHLTGFKPFDAGFKHVSWCMHLFWLHLSVMLSLALVSGPWSPQGPNLESLVLVSGPGSLQGPILESLAFVSGTWGLQGPILLKLKNFDWNFLFYHIRSHLVLFFRQRCVHAGATLLYNNGILSVRPTVRHPAGRKTAASRTALLLGEADRQRDELSAYAQDHTSRLEVTQVSYQLAWISLDLVIVVVEWFYARDMFMQHLPIWSPYLAINWMTENSTSLHQTLSALSLSSIFKHVNSLNLSSLHFHHINSDLLLYNRP